MIRLGLCQFDVLTEDLAQFAKQFGVNEVLLGIPQPPGGKQYWEFKDVLRLRTRAEDYGLHLEAIEVFPRNWYDKIMIGLPGRDEQIENYMTSIRSMGQAGIPILGQLWMPNWIWRTSSTTPARGGARVSSFDYELVKDAPLTHGRVYTEQEMWDNYIYFLKAIVPVLEKSGVKFAIHPDDPPVPSLGGVHRMFSSIEGLKKAVEVVPSDNVGLGFCQGCVSEMCDPAGVKEAIRYFGSRNKILYAHFRNVIGIVPKFRESFIDEGKVDMLDMLRTYKEVGFDGCIVGDHFPTTIGDTPWPDCHRARAYTYGYINGLLRAVYE